MGCESPTTKFDSVRTHSGEWRMLPEEHDLVHNWFRRHQHPDGHWGVPEAPFACKSSPPCKIAGEDQYALLANAMVAEASSRFNNLTQRSAIDWIKKQQRPDGLFVDPSHRQFALTHLMSTIAMLRSDHYIEGPIDYVRLRHAVDALGRDDLSWPWSLRAPTSENAGLVTAMALYMLRVLRDENNYLTLGPGDVRGIEFDSRLENLFAKVAAENYRIAKSRLPGSDGWSSDYVRRMITVPVACAIVSVERRSDQPEHQHHLMQPGSDPLTLFCRAYLPSPDERMDYVDLFVLWFLSEWIFDCPTHPIHHRWWEVHLNLGQNLRRTGCEIGSTGPLSGQYLNGGSMMWTALVYLTLSECTRHFVVGVDAKAQRR